MSDNKPYNAVELILDGKSYSLCPTFEALITIEQQLDTSIVALARNMADGELMLEGLEVIVTQCIQPNMPPSFVREAFLCSGLAEVTQSVAAMLVQIFDGHDATAEPQAAMTRGELENMIRKFPD